MTRVDVRHHYAPHELVGLPLAPPRPEDSRPFDTTRAVANLVDRGAIPERVRRSSSPTRDELRRLLGEGLARSHAQLRRRLAAGRARHRPRARVFPRLAGAPRLTSV